MPDELLPLEVRVERSLSRIGFDNLEVTHTGNGNIVVTGQVKDANDRVIIVAAARAVAGVVSVKSDVRF